MYDLPWWVMGVLCLLVVAAPVVLSATSERALDVVPLELLQAHSVDVPPDLSALD